MNLAKMNQIIKQQKNVMLETINQHKHFFAAKFPLTHDKLIRIHETLFAKQIMSTKVKRVLCRMSKHFCALSQMQITTSFLQKLLKKMRLELAQKLRR